MEYAEAAEDLAEEQKRAEKRSKAPQFKKKRH